ncbi:MAG TPA: TOBE domain-containing protein, partial [Acidobacteriota bacterium]
PASVKVADFIGQMNFVDASVKELANGEAVLETAGLGTIRTRGAPAFVRQGDVVVVAVRPEKLMLSPERSDTCAGVQGTMTAATYLGDRSHFYVSVEGRERALAVSAQGASAASAQFMDRGSPVWVSWTDDSLILLPRP